jgi:hypothetical protein
MISLIANSKSLSGIFKPNIDGKKNPNYSDFPKEINQLLINK